MAVLNMKDAFYIRHNYAINDYSVPVAGKPVKNRAEQLGLQLDDGQIKYLTREIKEMADHGRLTLDDVDSLLYEAAQRNNSNGWEPLVEAETETESENPSS